MWLRKVLSISQFSENILIHLFFTVSGSIIRQNIYTYFFIVTNFLCIKHRYRKFLKLFWTGLEIISK